MNITWSGVAYVAVVCFSLGVCVCVCLRVLFYASWKEDDD
jgi:hypothetical protein